MLVGKDRSEKQSVALGSAMQFERHPTSEALDGAYAARPRTRIYEGYDARTGGWPAMVTRILMRLADCRVVCSVYESSARDQNLGPHRDGWYGAVVQMLGEKAWLLGDGADDPSAEPTLLLSPGDVLMVPKGVLHDVRTPDHSVHMAFALITDEPQLSPQNSPK